MTRGQWYEYYDQLFSGDVNGYRMKSKVNFVLFKFTEQTIWSCIVVCGM